MKLLRPFVFLCLFAALTTQSALAGGPYPGTYAGKGKGVKAKLVVNQELTGNLSFSMKTACGRSHGKIAVGALKNGAFKGKRVSAGPHSTLRKTSARVAIGGDGTTLKGMIRDSVSGGKSRGCSAKRTFKAELDRSTDVFVPVEDDGHYSGQSKDGLAISFDVVSDPGSGKAKVTNLSADVLGDCYSEGDDAFEQSMVVHLAGLEGTISAAGEVAIDYAPDDDTEFAVDGQLGGGQARLEVSIDGYFDSAGEPDPASDIYCDNWGAVYEASRS